MALKFPTSSTSKDKQPATGGTASAVKPGGQKTSRSLFGFLGRSKASAGKNPPASGWRWTANSWVAASAAARTDIRLVVSDGATAFTRMP